MGRRIDDLRKRLDSVRPLAPEDEHRVLQKLRLDWNYHSNAIEGNALDHGETRAFLMHGITAKGKPLKDYLDIRGHNEAIDYLLKFARDQEELHEADIRALHKVVLAEPYDIPAETADGRHTTRRVNLGQYKTTPNSVRTDTGEVHQFPAPEQTPALMQELMVWLNENQDEYHPVERAALLHHRFVEIHPFDDGNGRMARLLMNLLLMQAGYPPAIIRQEARGEYYAALAQADSGDPFPIIEIVGKSLIHSMEIYVSASQGQPIEEPNDLEKELRLLEQDLESRAQKIDAKLDEESRHYTAEHVISRAWKSITSVVSRFERLFLSSTQGRVVWTHLYDEDEGGEVPALSYSVFPPEATLGALLDSTIDTQQRLLMAVVSLQDFRDLSNPFGVEVRFAVELLDFSIILEFWLSPVNDLWGFDYNTAGLGTPNFHLEIPYRRALTELEDRTLSESLKKELLAYIKRHDKNPEADLLQVNEKEIMELIGEHIESQSGTSGFSNANVAGIDEEKRTIFLQVRGRPKWSMIHDEQERFLTHLIRSKNLHFHPRISISVKPSDDDIPF